MLLLIHVKPPLLRLVSYLPATCFYLSHRGCVHFRICCLGPKADAAGHSHVQPNPQAGRTRRTMPGHLTTASMGELQNLLKMWIWPHKITCKDPRTKIFSYFRGKASFPFTTCTVLVLGILRQLLVNLLGDQRPKRWMLLSPKSCLKMLPLNICCNPGCSF